ncbi:MAG: glycosyltransferase family 2 protein [Candidatus Marinimicrobia bacterium]|nr:glycosyltransferase family 2 protein [Candidatus Neomarinimicrobiota bacterium]
MTWPKLSIVIFSDADPDGCVRILTDCERLKHQDLEFEVIMVLQGLTEKVEKMLKAYTFSYNLKFVMAASNANRAMGRNQGVARAVNEIILFLDSDLEISPELLYYHLEAYSDSQTAAVMGEIFLPEFVKKSRWLRFMDSSYRSTRRWAATTDVQTSPPLRYVNTANFSVKKTYYQACGGHCESIGNHEAENIDLAHRISALKQGIIRYQPEAITFCQHPPLKKGLRMKYEFGLEGIPGLLELYPDLYPVLPSRFVKSAEYASVKPVFRAFMSLLFTRPVFFVARGLRLLSPEFITFRMLRYMLQYEAVRGFRASIQDQPTNSSN